MTLEEFKMKRNALKRQYEFADMALQQEYAFANNPFKIGDIIESYAGRILVDKIQVSTQSFGLPTCVYSGVKLKKDNNPFKDGSREVAYQSNNPVKIK